MAFQVATEEALSQPVVEDEKLEVSSPQSEEGSG